MLKNEPFPNLEAQARLEAVLNRFLHAIILKEIRIFSRDEGRSRIENQLKNDKLKFI
jgi:hypothetical protein